MKKITLIFLGTALSSLSLMAQNYLSSDRPGQTYSSAVIGKDSFQVQAGTELYRLQWPSSAGQPLADFAPFYPAKDQGFLSAVDLRYGFFSGLELMVSAQVQGQERFFWDGPSSLPNPPPNVSRQSTSAGIQIGLRQSYTVSKSFQFGFLTRAEVLASNNWFEWRPLWSWSLSSRFNLSGNLALAYHEQSFFHYRGTYTLNGAFAITDDWGLFLEQFGTLWFEEVNDPTLFQPAFDAGAYCYLQPALMLDLSLTYGRYEDLDFLVYNQPNIFWSAALGLSWHIP